MEDMFLVLILAIICGISAGIGGFVARTVWDTSTNRAIKTLEIEVDSLKAGYKQYRQQEGNSEKKARMAEAMAKFAAGMKAEGADAKKVAIEVALSYPDIALDLAKKMGIGF